MKSGKSPLHVAAEKGRAEAVRELLQWGADTEAVDKVRIICGHANTTDSSRARARPLPRFSLVA